MIHLALVLALGAPAETAPEPIAVEPATESADGAQPDGATSGQPPNPAAQPSEGVYAVGSSGVAPLPPAPPPVPPSAIPAGSWRGQVWIGGSLLVSGGFAGTTPGRPSIISVGGSFEGGWRARQWIGIGAGVSHWPHEVVRRQIPGQDLTQVVRGHGTAWDLAFVRLFAPIRGRVDPHLDVGGGLFIYDPARDLPSVAGATFRAGLGVDGWVGRTVTLGVLGLYRANFVDGSVGHGWQAGLTLGLHW